MSATPNIGEMDEQIVIETYTVTKQDSGERTRSWTAFASVWAKVEEKAGNKSEEDEKLTAIEAIAFTIRYVANVSNKMRVKWNDEYYTIREVNEIVPNTFIEIITDIRKV